jgi:acyl carrier protein
MREMIREILAEFGRLVCDIERVDDRDDLYSLGMTSHATVNVMLGLEEAFDVEFPEALLKKATFQSVSAIEAAVEDLCKLRAVS